MPGPKAKGHDARQTTKAARAPRAAKDPKADFEAAKYLNADGKDCIPAGALRNAIIGAGRVVEGVPMTRIRGRLPPRGHDPATFREVLYARGHGARRRQGPGTGTADLRYRPEYTGWRATLKIDYNASVISLAELLNLIQGWQASLSGCASGARRRAGTRAGSISTAPRARSLGRRDGVGS